MKKFFMPRLARAISAVTAESRIWRTIFALLVIAVGYLALTPTPPASIDLGWDKLNHVAAFSALAFTGYLSYPASRNQRILLLLGLVTYGGAIEIIQLFLSLIHI